MRVELRDLYIETGIVGPHTEIPHDKPFPEPAMPDLD